MARFLPWKVREASNAAGAATASRAGWSCSQRMNLSQRGLSMDEIREGAGERAEHVPLDVVVIDDEEMFSEGCRQTLEMGGYRAEVARDGQKGLDLVRATRPRVVLVDLKMPGMTGIEVLGHLVEIGSTVVPIVISGHGTVDSAVESMKIGAFDFITKPFDPEKLLETVRRGMNLSSLRHEAVATVQPDISRTLAGIQTPPPDKQNMLLQGLEILGECYSLGMEKRQFLEELFYLENEAKYHAKSLGQIKQKERAILDIRDELVTADGIMMKYDFQKSALIQIMLDVQERYRWLPRHILRWVGGRLNVTLKEIYTIANFYGAFSLEPRGRHEVQVCTGTACHVRGSSEMLTRVSSLLGLKPGETDSRQQFTLETVNCIGCCALAPVVKVDDDYHHNPSRKKLEKVVKSLQKQEGSIC
jgi:NADH-quinone oxidoreductase subunit E